MGKPSPPKPPDPMETAGAQTGTNIGTAVANQLMSQTNQVTPQGSLTYRQTGQTAWRDPNTGRTHRIPQMEQRVRLSPQQREIYQNNERTSNIVSRAGTAQARRVEDALGSPMDFDGIPKVKFGNEARKRAEGALMERMNPYLDRDRERLESRLSNQGIKLGSTAYDRGMEDFGRQSNDARLGAIISAGGEADRMYSQSLGARQQGIEERLTMRNQPLNEVSAMMSGSQVSMPRFSATPQTNMPTTDVAGLINSNYGAQMNAYNTRAQQRSDLLGGLLGAGGQLGAAYIASDRRAKRSIKKVGKTNSGQPIYTFKYKGELDDGKTHMGLMAQDVQKRRPEAVEKFGDILAVDYSKAV